MDFLKLLYQANNAALEPSNVSIFYKRKNKPEQYDYWSLSMTTFDVDLDLIDHDLKWPKVDTIKKQHEKSKSSLKSNYLILVHLISYLVF